MGGGEAKLMYGQVDGRPTVKYPKERQGVAGQGGKAALLCCHKLNCGVPSGLRVHIYILRHMDSTRAKGSSSAKNRKKCNGQGR